MNHENTGILARLTSGELLPDLRRSRVIADGRARVAIENHAGLTAYTTACIRVRTSRGEIAVEGDGLSLSVMEPGLLEITGRIDAVRFL